MNKVLPFNHLHGETAIEGAFLDKNITSYLFTELYVFALLSKMPQWGFIKCVHFFFTCSKMEKYLPSHMFINYKESWWPTKEFNATNTIKELGKIIDSRWVSVVNWFEDHCIYIHILGDWNLFTRVFTVLPVFSLNFV